QPDGVAAAALVFRHVSDDVESIRRQQRAIFIRIKARVLQRPAFEYADSFVALRSAGEHQRGVFSSMTGESRKHRALVVRGEIKETVPRENSIELSVQR